MAMYVYASIVSILALLVVLVRCEEIRKCMQENNRSGRCIPLVNCPEIHKLTMNKPMYHSDINKIIALAGACGGNLRSATFLVCCEFPEDVTERPPSKGSPSTTTFRTTRPTTTTARPAPTTTTRLTSTTTITTRPTSTTTTRPTSTTTTTSRTATSTPAHPIHTTTLPTPTTLRPTPTTASPTYSTTRTAPTITRPIPTTSHPETTTTTPSPTTRPSTTRLPPIGNILPTNCGMRPASEHIWSNVEDSEHVHRWAVFLEISKSKTISGRCVGTMITDRFVLTAAHCLHNLKIDDVTMNFGLFNRSELADCLDEDICQQKKAAQFIIHEEYHAHQKLNDVALILTEDSVQTSDYIAPICLPWNHTFDESNSSTVFSFGWGRTFGETLSDTKRVALLRVIPQEDCEKSLRFNTTALSSVMCTLGYQPGQDVCQGDSGAPLVQYYQHLMYVVGVVSYGPRCGMTLDVPGKAMRVSHYMNWILTTIRRYAPPTINHYKPQYKLD